jgi:hypothetical protein
MVLMALSPVEYIYKFVSRPELCPPVPVVPADSSWAVTLDDLTCFGFDIPRAVQRKRLDLVRIYDKYERRYAYMVERVRPIWGQVLDNGPAISNAVDIEEAFRQPCGDPNCRICGI